MNRIYCIVGKSASGKDTIYKKILSEFPSLIPVIPYTTRPKRINEVDGVDYNFVNEAQLNELEKDNLVIEKRVYHTIKGDWTYFTKKFDLVDGKDYILITTLEGALGIREHYGDDIVNMVYMTLDDKTRLIRCIERESKQSSPNYAEVCRRFLADEKDFSDEKILVFKNIYYINTIESVDACVKQWEKIYKG